jgi:hypothetical protein
MLSIDYTAFSLTAVSAQIDPLVSAEKPTIHPFAPCSIQEEETNHFSILFATIVNDRAIETIMPLN